MMDLQRNVGRIVKIVHSGGYELFEEGKMYVQKILSNQPYGSQIVYKA